MPAEEVQGCLCDSEECIEHEIETAVNERRTTEHNAFAARDNCNYPLFLGGDPTQEEFLLTT